MTGSDLIIGVGPSMDDAQLREVGGTAFGDVINVACNKNFGNKGVRRLVNLDAEARSELDDACVGARVGTIMRGVLAIDATTREGIVKDRPDTFVLVDFRSLLFDGMENFQRPLDAEYQQRRQEKICDLLGTVSAEHDWPRVYTPSRPIRYFREIGSDVTRN